MIGPVWKRLKGQEIGRERKILGLLTRTYCCWKASMARTKGWGKRNFRP